MAGFGSRDNTRFAFYAYLCSRYVRHLVSHSLDKAMIY